MNLASIIFDNKVELSKVNIGGMDMNYNGVAFFLYNNNFMTINLINSNINNL